MSDWLAGRQVEWEVPEYEAIFSEGRKRKYGVVIPVINEGERIISLLTRMKKLNLMEVVDIIVVDGGSTDGSLDVQNLKNLDVNSLLVKKGPGQLSAQLRCAYEFILISGYYGVVTIDGNDKDDPAAIPSFIEELKQGVDFIQGSRFIKGGKAKNTPVSRELAIRLIHAPLLTLASGFKWTDTTQGFRGYSRQLLLNKQLAVFRSIFNAYELLAYLSYRAPKLGFKCKELATCRQYPEGNVPTKIHGWKGNLKVFKTLVCACLGKYNT